MSATVARGMATICLGYAKGMELDVIGSGRWGQKKEYRMSLKNSGEQNIAVFYNSDHVSPQLIDACRFKDCALFCDDYQRVTRIYADEIIICTIHGVASCIKLTGENIRIDQF